MAPVFSVCCHTPRGGAGSEVVAPHPTVVHNSGVAIMHYVSAPMFVRWQKRRLLYERFSRQLSGDTSWYASLVNSTRVNGKPRLQHVAYLGSFRESKIKWRSDLEEIWREIEFRLSSLEAKCGITPSEQRRIRAALRKKIPPPAAGAAASRVRGKGVARSR